MSEIENKTCSKCSETKPVSEFYQDQRAAGGIRSDCKECRKIYDSNRYARETEKILENKAEYYKANTEKIKAYKRKYREENREKIDANNNRSKAKKPEKYRKINAETAARMRAKYPHKHAARRAIYDAIRRKEIVRPTVCIKCSFIGKVEAHHEDYSKPFDIQWLCKRCHTGLTKSKLNRIAFSGVEASE